MALDDDIDQYRRQYSQAQDNLNEILLDVLDWAWSAVLGVRMSDKLREEIGEAIDSDSRR